MDEVPEGAVEAPRPPATATRPRLVTGAFVTIMLSSLAYFTAAGITIPAVPLYVEGPLGGGDVAVGLIVGVFGVTAIVLRPWAGGASDRRGRRLLVVAGALLAGISIAGYLVPNMGVLTGMRLLTGAGEAFFFVGVLAAIGDLAPPERRGEAMSYFSLALYAGVGLGPLLAEPVIGTLGFAAVWWLAAGLCVGAAALAVRLVDTRGDVVPTTERRRIVHPAGLLPGAILLTAMWGLAGFFAFVPLYAPEAGVENFRWVFVTFSVVMLTVRSVGARIPDLLGPARSGILALSGVALGMATIALWRTPVGLYAGTVVFAMGNALATPGLLALALRRAPDTERGSVMGTTSAFIDLGFAVGPASLGFVAAAAGRPAAFLAAAAVAVGGLVLLVARRRSL